MAQAPTLADLPTLAPMVAAGAPLLAVASAAVLRRGPLQATPLEAFLGMLAGGKGEEEWSEVGVGTALSSWFLSLQVPLLLLVAAAAVALIHKRLSGAASADAKPAPRAPRPQSRAVARGANGGVGSGNAAAPQQSAYMPGGGWCGCRVAGLSSSAGSRMCCRRSGRGPPRPPVHPTMAT